MLVSVVIGRRQLAGSVVDIQRRAVRGSLRIMMMRLSVRQHRGRAGGRDKEPKGNGEETPVTQVAHRCEGIQAPDLLQPSPSMRG